MLHDYTNQNIWYIYISISTYSFRFAKRIYIYFIHYQCAVYLYMIRRVLIRYEYKDTNINIFLTLNTHVVYLVYSSLSRFTGNHFQVVILADITFPLLSLDRRWGSLPKVDQFPKVAGWVVGCDMWRLWMPWFLDIVRFILTCRMILNT